jgi:hypothetical protein
MQATTLTRSSLHLKRPKLNQFFGVLGPTPPQISASILQAVLATEAPSIRVLATNGSSAKFYVRSPNELDNLTSIASLMPNTQLQIRVRLPNGKSESLNRPKCDAKPKSAPSTQPPSGNIANSEQQSCPIPMPKLPARHSPEIKHSPSETSTEAATPSSAVPQPTTSVRPITYTPSNHVLEQLLQLCQQQIESYKSFRESAAQQTRKLEPCINKASATDSNNLKGSVT